jgi:DNA-binding Xre family transcriptional regulator
MELLRLRVKEIAHVKRISMHKLSLQSQVSYHVIREIFNDPYKVVNTDTINRIATALDVPVTELIEDVSPSAMQAEMAAKETK